MRYQHKREPLSIEEADRIINACETMEEKICIWALLETGMRVSELANLTRNQIQWQQRCIRLYGKGGPYGKRTKLRVVPLSDRVRALFEHYFILHETIDFSARTTQRTVRRVANAATISRPVSPHVLRHTFAILWIHKGGSTRALQMMLGHDHLSTTEIYLNMSPEFVLQEFRTKW